MIHLLLAQASESAPNYWEDNPAGLLLFWVPVIIIGCIVEYNRQKKFKSGEIKGVHQSKNVADWMFYDFHE